MEGWVAATDSNIEASSLGSEHWEPRLPKPKNKKDKPIPYEYLNFASVSVSSDILAKLNKEGFGIRIIVNGYKYWLMAGGIGRRKI